MKISELIKELEERKDKYGDLPVWYQLEEPDEDEDGDICLERCLYDVFVDEDFYDNRLNKARVVLK